MHGWLGRSTALPEVFLCMNLPVPVLTTPPPFPPKEEPRLFSTKTCTFSRSSGPTFTGDECTDTGAGEASFRSSSSLVFIPSSVN